MTFQLDPNELKELFVDDSIQLSNVKDIDYHDFFDISYYFSENSENIIANMQTQSSSFLITMHINIRSLPANFDKLQSLLANMKLKPHIVSINETWLTTKKVNLTTCQTMSLFPIIEYIAEVGVLHCMLMIPYHLVFVMIYL